MMSKCMFWKVLFFSMASMTFCHFLLKKIPNFPVSLQLSKVRFLQNSYHLMTKIAHKNSWIASWKAKQKSHQNFIFVWVVLFFYSQILNASWPIGHIFCPIPIAFFEAKSAMFKSNHSKLHKQYNKTLRNT